MDTYTFRLRSFIGLCPKSCTTVIKTEKIGLRSCTDVPIDYNNCLSAVLLECRKTLETLALTNSFFEERLKTLSSRSIEYIIKYIYQSEETVYLADNMNLLWAVHEKDIHPIMIHIKPLFSYLFSNVLDHFSLYLKMINPIYSNTQIGLFKFSVLYWATCMENEKLELPENLFLQSIYFKKTREYDNNRVELMDIYYVYL